MGQDFTGVAPASPSVSLLDGGPAVDTGEVRLLGDCLERAARRSVDGALHLLPDGSERNQPYTELLAEAERIRGGLAELGLRPGDRVLLQLPATADLLAAFWGAVRGGLVPVPLACAADDASERSAAALATAWSWSASGSASGGPGAVVVAPRAAVEDLRRLGARTGAAFRLVALEDLAAGTPAGPPHHGAPDDPAVLLLTSGSTGEPKGVLLSHRNILCAIAGSARVNGFTSRTVSLNWLPLHHVGALMRTLRETWLGARQIQAPAAPVLADPLCWLDWMERHRATTAWAPNFAFGLIVEQEERVRAGRWDLSALRSLWNGGEPVAASTILRFYGLLAPHGLEATAMHTAWGMTEACFATRSHHYLLALREGRRVPEAGEPIPGLALRVVDDADRTVPQGTAGALQISGPVCATRYVQAAENARAFTADGWLRTGDLAVVEGGRLTIVGREKDVIILRGVNYSPAEIESAVEEVAGVERSFTAALPVRGEGRDTDGLAVLFHTRASGPELARLLGEIRIRLAREIGVVPDLLVPVDKAAIAKAAVGKIQRAVIRRRLEAGELAAELRAADRDLALAGGLAASAGDRTAAADAATTAAERAVATAFAEILGLGAVGVQDNFFALGGSSLHVVRVLARLAGLFPDRPPAAVDLLSHPSARELAAHLTRGLQEEAGGGIGSGARQEGRARAAARREGRTPRPARS